MDYIIKPFHPATGSSSGQPMPVTRNEPRETASQSSTNCTGANSRGVLPSPDVSPSPAPETVPAMQRLDLDKGAEWCRILREARPMEAKFSLKDIAVMVGSSAGTLCKLLKRFKKIPTNELTPEKLAPTKAGGRECDFEFLLKDEAFKRKMLELYVATIGASSARAANDRRTAKLATALKNLPYEPECPEVLKPRLLAGYMPKPFVDYLRAAVTPEMEMRIRGPKHYQLYGPSCRRDETCRLPDGSRFERPAVYSLSMDDMSANHPFWVDYRAGADSDVILSRQGLYAVWAKHHVWQSVELVARIHESYTAADILRAFYKMCLAMGGVPPFVEFEQGVWHSKKISGWKRDGEWLVEETVERPGMATAEMQNVSNGLGLCGVKVNYQHCAHTKHIETHFNKFQDVLAIVARQFQCIGRYAGEFEHGGKQLRRIRAGSHHPSELGFASQAQLADCIASAFERINALPSNIAGKTRCEAHWEDLDRVGLLPLTPRLFAACLPGEMHKTTIRNGCVSVGTYPHDFQFRREDFVRLGDGYELYYKFDESDPNLGCAIFNRTSQANSANFQHWQPGEFMFSAPREIPGPKLEVASAPAGVEIKTVEQLYGAGAVDRGDSIKRSQNKFVATQFRSMPRPGQIAVRSASARDGRGNVVEVTNVDAPVATTENRPAAQLPCDGSRPAAALPPRPVTGRRSFITAPTKEEFARKRQRLAESAARARELTEMTAA